MQILHISELRPGMILLKPVVCRFSYQILLNSGTILNDNYINLLSKYDIDHIYVGNDKDCMSKENELANRVSNITDNKAAKEIYLSIFHEYDNLVNDIRFGNTILIEPIQFCIQRLVEFIDKNHKLFLQLTVLKDNDPVAYTHSLNVAIFSLVLGKILNFNYKQMVNLGVGALLHDIGKLVIPENILYKESRLTDKEFSVIKRHPLEGYNILIRNNLGNSVILSIVRDHHERCDGSGYPSGLSSKELLPETRLVSIADVYEAITTDRCYRPKMQPHEGVEILMGYSSLNNLDATYVKKFLSNIAIYPVGALVELSNETYGKVIEVYPQVPTRPRIQIIDIDTKNTYNHEVVDLLFNPTIFIKKIIN